jgi:hypothetical protein
MGRWLTPKNAANTGMQCCYPCVNHPGSRCLLKGTAWTANLSRWGSGFVIYSQLYIFVLVSGFVSPVEEGFFGISSRHWGVLYLFIYLFIFIYTIYIHRLRLVHVTLISYLTSPRLVRYVHLTDREQYVMDSLTLDGDKSYSEEQVCVHRLWGIASSSNW